MPVDRSTFSILVCPASSNDKSFFSQIPHLRRDGTDLDIETLLENERTRRQMLSYRLVDMLLLDTRTVVKKQIQADGYG